MTASVSTFQADITFVFDITTMTTNIYISIASVIITMCCSPIIVVSYITVKAIWWSYSKKVGVGQIGHFE